MNVAHAGYVREHPPAAPARLGVLIVDDETDLCEEIADTIAREGYDTEIAHSTGAARSMLAARSDIGVMISDVRMPDGDGIELTREVLHGRSDRQSLEVILMTGHATLDGALAAISSGAREMLRKPVRAAEIVGALSSAMARAVGRRALSQGAAAAPPQPDRIESVLARSGVSGLQALSHELRTPLVPILGFAELLETVDQSEQTRRYAGEIVRAARRLVVTVDNMIALVRLQCGEAALTWSRCQARSLLETVAQGERASAAAQGFAIDVQAEDGLTLRIDIALMLGVLRALTQVAQLLTPRGAGLRLGAVRSAASAALSVEAYGLRPASEQVATSGPYADALAQVAQAFPISSQFCDRVVMLQGGALSLARSDTALFRAEIRLPALPVGQ